VHDIVDLESRGVPGIFVASNEFVSGADAQAAALGFPDVARSYVPHPIQDRTDDEIRELARQVFDEVLRLIVNS
jgi:hypothetical protein